MPTSPEVQELILILTEEGFGFLAGELLVELQIGEDDASDMGTVDDLGRRPHARSREDQMSREVRLDDGQLVERLYFDHSVTADDDGGRRPVPEGQQFSFALDYLTRRLVQPLEALAEAQSIAGEIQSGYRVGDDGDAQVVDMPPLLNLMLPDRQGEVEEDARPEPQNVRFAFRVGETEYIPSDSIVLADEIYELQAVLSHLIAAAS